MIELSVQDYCHHGCMDFEPRVARLVADNAPGSVLITCVNSRRCEYMVRYLSNHTDEERKPNVHMDESYTG